MPLEAKSVKGVADIVFCVDCTGSMTPCIEQLKTQIGTFISELENPIDQNQRKIDWQLRVIGFRDLNSDAVPWINRDSPMTASLEEARAQLAALSAEGGGDAPESALDALWFAVAKTEWRPMCTKVVVLFSDAPALDRLHDSTVAAGAVGSDVSAVAQLLAEKGIWVRIFAAACPAWTELRIPKAVFQDVGGVAGLESVDFSEVLKVLAKTVSQASQADAAQGVTEAVT